MTSKKAKIPIQVTREIFAYSFYTIIHKNAVLDMKTRSHLDAVLEFFICSLDDNTLFFLFESRLYQPVACIYIYIGY
jgi:ABC-type uncharacterized transport system substrate-binding protein